MKNRKPQATQTLPLRICRYFWALTPAGKRRDLTYTSMPYGFAASRYRGQRPEHVTTKRVAVGTTLPDVLQALADAARRKVDEGHVFQFTTMASGRIKIGIHNPAWEGVALVAWRTSK